MNLFDIDTRFWSHPEHTLQDHLAHIAASFDIPIHKEAAWFHDTGKLTDEFQAYIRKQKAAGRSTHALESALVFLEHKGYELTPSSFAVFYAILKHHGNLEDTASYFYNKFGDVEDLEYYHPYLKSRLETICHRLGDLPLPNPENICDLLGQEDFLEENDLIGCENYFFIKEIFSRLIFSDKYEAIFKTSHIKKASYQWDQYETVLKDLITSKNNAMSNLRNQARQEIIAQYNKNKNKNIFFIEAPTGIGKTFSAFHLALTICKDKNKKRIINALPMTSIIDQTYEEYAAVTGTGELLKFHHLTRSKTYASHSNEDDIENQHFSHQQNDFISMSWSEDRIIVTTFNQLFNIFYSNRNRDLIKFWTIRDSVIIMDEIQAIPRVLIQDVAKTMASLAVHFNIDFILMSATIPEINRFIPNELTASLLDNNYFLLDFNNRYTLRLAPEINEYQILVSNIKSACNNHNSLLCVVNSKKLSLELFTDLLKSSAISQNSFKLFFLNTNLIPKHRSAVIHEIHTRLKNKMKTLLVSTQVIEAGVDLDFDFGIREFAPLYAMIQTAGRINRENRPGLNKTAQLLVTNTIGFTPYHPTDLLKNEVIQLLSSDIPENRLLPILKQYFEIAIERTPKDPLLIPKMEILDFETTFKTFSDHFMKGIPGITQVFIETEEKLYQKFFNQIDIIYGKMQEPGISLEKIMTLKTQLKDQLKQIAQYTINVAENETNDLQDFHKLVPTKVCPYQFIKNESKYSLTRGWLGEETLTLTI